MTTYTATDNKTGKSFTFRAAEGNDAASKAEKKFKTTDVTMHNDETGEEFQIVEEWLNETAYIRRCHVSGRLLIFVKADTPMTKGQFVPVSEVTSDIVTEDVISEYGYVEKRKSTHKVGNWYVGLQPFADGSNYVCKNYIEKNGNVTLIAL